MTDERKYASTEELIDDMMESEFGTWTISEISERLSDIQTYAETQLTELNDIIKDAGLEDEAAALPLRAKASTLVRVLKSRIKACKALLNEPWG